MPIGQFATFMLKQLGIYTCSKYPVPGIAEESGLSANFVAQLDRYAKLYHLNIAEAFDKVHQQTKQANKFS